MIEWFNTIRLQWLQRRAWARLEQITRANRESFEIRLFAKNRAAQKRRRA